MAAIFKNMNSINAQTLTFTNQDLEYNNLPFKMPDGSDIPINNFGINIDTFDIYYWDGSSWVKSS